MDNRIEAAFSTAFMATETTNNNDQPIGSWNGRDVTPNTDILSLLADAAEELTFSAQETQEKKIAERKLVEESNPLDAFEKVEKLIQQLDDINKNDLERLLEAIKQGTKNSEDLQKALQQFPDPTHKHAALTYMKEQLQGDANTELRSLVETALNELMEHEGPAVRAGYNIAGVDHGGLAGDAGALRGLYRGTVLDYESFSQAFDKLVDQYGADDFPKALGFLIRALTADMASTTPSTTMPQLKGIMDDLYQLEVLGNFFRDSESLLDRLEKLFGRKMRATPRDIMSPILRLKDERFVQDSQITATMPFLVTSDAACDVQFTQGIKDNVRKLPHKLFHDGEKRHNLLDALQSVLDAAIDREEGGTS